MTFKQWLKENGACEEALKWVKKNNITSAEEAWRKCKKPGWLSWFADNVFIDSNIDILVEKHVPLGEGLTDNEFICDTIRKEFVVPIDYVIDMAIKVKQIEDILK